MKFFFLFCFNFIFAVRYWLHTVHTLSIGTRLQHTERDTARHNRDFKCTFYLLSLLPKHLLPAIPRKKKKENKWIMKKKKKQKKTDASSLRSGTEERIAKMMQKLWSGEIFCLIHWGDNGVSFSVFVFVFSCNLYPIF